MRLINKMKKGSIYLMAITAFASCRNDMAEPMPKPCDTIPTVSFSKHILPVFNQNCNIAGCHGGTNPAKNLNLEASVAFTQLMSKGYIDTLKPEYSIVYAEMVSISNPMPPTGRLDSCTTKLILKWIQQKARNN